MNKILTCVVAMVCATSLAFGQGSDATLLTAGDTPQRNNLNPAHIYNSSYLAIPIVGGFSLGITNSFSYNDIIDGNKYLHLDAIKDGDGVIIGANIDFVNLGIKIDEKQMATIAVRSRTYGGLQYPVGIFDILQNNPIGVAANYDVQLEGNVMSWGEIAFGYSRKINDNFNVGAKVKYIMGVSALEMGNSHLLLEKASNNSYLISGDVNIRTGNYNATNSDFFGAHSPGLGVDLGVEYHSDDNRWSIGASILDLGFISWSDKSSSYIVNSDKSQKYLFDGLGDLNEVLDDGDFGKLLEDTYDDILESMQVDTLTQGYTSMLPTTLHIGGDYKVDPAGRHTLSGNYMSYFVADMPYNYSFTAGYTYSNIKDSFRLMGSFTTGYRNPLSMGLGVLAQSKGFQFYLMGESTLAGMHGINRFAMRMGANVMLGKR